MVSAADVCVKLGYTTLTSEKYKRFVSNFKETWLRQQHPELIIGPVAPREAHKSVEWETGIRTMYTDFPVQWALANFENQAEHRECATQFLIAQAKKVRQDMKSEAKTAAEAARAATTAAIAKRAKRGTVAAAPATPAPATPRTCRAPRNPVAPPAPATPRTSRTHRSPLANRPDPVSSSTLPSSSPLANRGAPTTRKWARFVVDDDDNDGEVPRSPSRPPTKQQRQVELPELQFNTFSVAFRGPDSNRIHSTTYGSVNEFPRLVLWARERAPQLRTVLMLLKTTITLQNDEYLDIFPDVEQGGRVELGILDKGSWNSALMMPQGNRPNAGSFVGLLVVGIAAERDQNHGISEEIMPDYTGEDEDEREPGRGNRPGNSRPEDSWEAPSRPSGLSGQSRSPGGEGAAGDGDNAGDGGSGQSGDDDDGDSDGDSDRDGGGNNNNNDLYSRPSPGM